MDLFKLVGSIFIKNEDANSQIDTTAKKAESMATKVGSALQTAGTKISNVGKTLVPVSAVMATALGASVKGASDFTDGMAKMSTLFDTSKTSVSDLSKEFITLSNKTGLSATELAEAGYQALSAGVDVDDAVGFVETAGNLAKAGFTSTSTAVDVLTTAMNAYGKNAGTAEQISNKLVRTQNLGKTTVDELASSMGKIIPTASAMNVDINNLTAGYVTLTKQGITTAESTTYMNSMLNELGDSGTTVGGILKSKTGKSFQQLMSEGYSLGDVLGILQQDAKDSGTEFNELWGSAEAGKAGLAILNGGVDEFNSTVEVMKSDVDDVGDALDKLDTPSVKAKKALNQIKNSGIELGSAFLSALMPTIEKVVGAVEKFTTWFSNLDTKTKTVIATIMALVAGLAPALMMIGKVVSVIGTAVSWFGTLSTAISSTGGVMALLTNPITLVIGAIVGLIAIFVTLYNTNEDFRKTVQTAWETIKTTISGVIEAVKGLIQAFITIVKAAWDQWGQDIINVVTNAFTFISTFVNSVLNVIKAIIQTVTALIKGDWSGVWEGIKAIASAVWEGIKGIVTAGINLVKSIIQLGLNVIKTIWTTVWNAIKSLASTVWSGIKTVITTAINGVKTVITTVMTAIKTVITTIWNAIKTAVTTVVNAIKTVITTVWNAIKTTVTTVVNGIKTTVTTVWNAIKTAVTTTVNGIKTTITTVWNGIKTTITTVMSGIKTGISTAWNNVKTTVSTAVNNVKTNVSNGFNNVKSTVTSKMSSIKSSISTAWSGIKSSISTSLSNIKTNVSTAFSNVVSTAQSKFNSVKSSISTAMSSAKTLVSNAISSIKGFFSGAHFSFPPIKLPHFSVSWSDFGPISLPHVSVSWYKKAMQNPYMLSDATIFGMNPKTGQALGGGEAGDEMIYGKRNLMNDIRESVRLEQTELAEKVDALTEMIEKLLNAILAAVVAGHSIVLDSGALVGELTPAIDGELGRIWERKDRG